MNDASFACLEGVLPAFLARDTMLLATRLSAMALADIPFAITYCFTPFPKSQEDRVTLR